MKWPLHRTNRRNRFKHPRTFSHPKRIREKLPTMSVSIPSTMRAIINKKPDKPPASPSERYDPIEIIDMSVPKVTPGTVLVKLRASALNHRDVYIREGMSSTDL